MSVAEDWTAFSVSWMSSVTCWGLPGACGSAPPGDPLRHGAPKAGGDTRLGRFLEIFRHRWHRSSKHNTCVIVPFQILCLSWRSFESRHFAAPNPLVQTHGDGVQLIGNPTKSPKTVMVFKSWPHEWGVWYFPILMIYEYFWLMTYHSCDDSEF
jgi:hypothetical protein